MLFQPSSTTSHPSHPSGTLLAWPSGSFSLFPSTRDAPSALHYAPPCLPNGLPWGLGRLMLPGSLLREGASSCAPHSCTPPWAASTIPITSMSHHVTPQHHGEDMSNAEGSSPSGSIARGRERSPRPCVQAAIPPMCITPAVQPTSAVHRPLCIPSLCIPNPHQGLSESHFCSNMQCSLPLGCFSIHIGPLTKQQLHYVSLAPNIIIRRGISGYYPPLPSRQPA